MSGVGGIGARRALGVVGVLLVVEFAVWSVCGGTALVGAIALLVVPAVAFPKRVAA